MTKANNFKRTLLATTWFVGAASTAALSASASYAQDAPAQPQPSAEAAAQEIIVTGSRISSPAVESMAPIQIVNAETIDTSGATNVQETLLENPVFGVPALSRTNSNFLNSGTGVATVDLRDLGSDRTLVLINGRRVVAGLPGTATVDLNVIPTQFVDRVDILTGGASSIYGSDAVAGVVNFIYKTDFEGIELEGQYGLTEHGDAQNYQISGTVGGNFGADDRGNVMVHLGYTKEGQLLSRERKNTRIDDISYFYFYAPYYDIPLSDYTRGIEPFFSSFPPQGRFGAGSRTFTYSPTGQLQPCFTANGATCSSALGTGVGPNGFNRQNFRSLAVPVERFLFAARGHYELTDNVRAFVEGTYNKTKAVSVLEPFPASSDDVYPVNGRAPIETLVNGVPVLNPLVPGPIAAAATDTDGDGLRDISFARRLSEVGNRGNRTTRDFYRFVVGFEGDIVDGRFRWDVSYNHGQTSESQSSNGQYNVLNFANAFAAIPDVNDVDNDGSTTDAVCASATARAQGCVPISIFGFNSITPEALAYIDAEQSYQTEITQRVLNANISGDLFQLPAGAVQGAIGGEYRWESSREDLDALTNAGLNAGNAIPDTAGKFNVKEIYGELQIPVLTDRPFFDELRLRGAARYADYSTVGGVFSWSAGGDWAPVEGLKFRGTYARAVRAPNIGELFTGPSQTFPTGLVDPCTGVGPAGGGDVGDRCRADPGVAANIAANGVFTLNQSDRQGVSGFDSGNPDLGEEKSDTITAGIVLQPSLISDALSGLTLSLDYWRIKIDDAIVRPPRQFILDQCYGQGDPFFCGLVLRRQFATGVNSAGSLDEINSPLFNGGALKGEGIDVVANYRFQVESLVPGTFNAHFAYTYLIDGYLIPVEGADKDVFEGEVGTPNHRFNVSLAYTQDKFKVRLSGNYIGRSYEDDQFLKSVNATREGFGLAPIGKHDIKIPAKFYTDAYFGYTPSESYEIFVGVKNLFDTNAPTILMGLPFNTTGADTAADVYDVFGRRFYGGVRLRF